MSPIGPSGGGGGPAGVSSSTVIQTGNASPVGAVTPTSAGSLYQDLTDGAVYVAIGATSSDWVGLGGAGDAGEAGISASRHSASRVDLIALAAGAMSGLSLTDLAGWNGSGNGLTWQAGAADGSQTLALQLGPNAAALIHQWNADGTYTLPIFGDEGTDAASLGQVSPLGTIVSGALPTAALVSGTAAQLSTTRDVESHTAVTFNPGVATTATCTVALSPDNSTFSTLCVVTKPVGTVFDGEIEDVAVRVPAGWYVKMTVVNATLGTTTYY